MHRALCLLSLMLMLETSLLAAELPRSAPEAQGVPSEEIVAFIDAVDRIDQMHSVMLMRHGSVVAEGWWEPYAAADRHMLFSLSKSLTSTAVGLAIAEGKLSLDDPVLPFFPDHAPAEPSDNLRAMRVRDLLAMNTGHHESDVKAFAFDSRQSHTRAFLAMPVAHKPGTHFVYNTPATYMCSAIVQKVTGETVLDYLRPRLFAPLGIENPQWTQSTEGVTFGGFGLSITTEDIARFGQLYLQQGQWNGKQLVPAEWVAAATTRQTSNGSNPASDWEQGYGYQFWRCRHGLYRGDGAFGQFCIVMPEQDAVLAITSGVGDMQAVMQAAWDHLLPALAAKPLAENPASHERLTKRLATLRVPPQSGSPSSPRAMQVSGATYEFAANDAGLSAITFDFGDKGTTLAVQAGEKRYSIPCRFDAWEKVRAPTMTGLIEFPSDDSVAIAASGAWMTDDVYAVKLAWYETPFYQKLTFRFADDDVTLDSEYNVSFGDPKLPRLVGRKR